MITNQKETKRKERQASVISHISSALLYTRFKHTGT